MILLVSAVAIIVLTVLFTFAVRSSDIPAVEPPSPVSHLEERRAAIYENLRDLQFEYRVGKLSDADYQQTKLGLQKELAGVLAEIERISGKAPAPAKPAAAAEAPQQSPSPQVPANPAEELATCPHCGAQFSSAMKFCGECGQSMTIAPGQQEPA